VSGLGSNSHWAKVWETPLRHRETASWRAGAGLRALVRCDEGNVEGAAKWGVCLSIVVMYREMKWVQVVLVAKVASGVACGGFSSACYPGSKHGPGACEAFKRRGAAGRGAESKGDRPEAIQVSRSGIGGKGKEWTGKA
jgi:hypothetical protein